MGRFVFPKALLEVIGYSDIVGTIGTLQEVYVVGFHYNYVGILGMLVKNGKYVEVIVKNNTY